MSHLAQLFNLSYVAQLFTLFLALFGAFYKNTQKKHGDNPVYWHGFPVLTPIGWILVGALVLSSAISIYSGYDKAQTAADEKAQETKRADTLQGTLNEVNSTSASSLKLQIDRFQKILDKQDRIGETTIGRISDSSTQLATDIDNSSGLLSNNISDSSELLRGNIQGSSSLLREHILEVALAGRTSVPGLELYVEKEGVVHNYSAMRAERDQANPNDLPLKSLNAIGFIPRSVRDVLFPFADNSFKNDAIFSIGTILLRFDEFGENQYSVRASGLVGPSISSRPKLVSMDTFINGSDSGVPLGRQDVFGLICKFDKDWSWEVMSQTLKDKFAKGNPIIIVNRTGVPNPPPHAPSFTRVFLIVILSKRPTIRIRMPLEVRNYLYDSTSKSYSYELSISAAPEIVTGYSR